MGSRAPPLAAAFAHHACVIHDAAVSAAECALIKSAVEEAFAGASVAIPEPTEEAMLEAVRRSKTVFVFLTRGTLASAGGGAARVRAVSEAVGLGRSFVLVHEMKPEFGGTASFYDYISETADERAKSVFNDATSIPW